MSNYRLYFKMARPFQLLLSTLTYGLGAGIARYLGRPINATIFGLGLFFVLATAAAAFWLVEYFRLPLMSMLKGVSSHHRDSQRITLFQSAIALLTISGVIIMTLLFTRLLPLGAGILIVLIVIIFVAYAVPPLRLSDTGYGEIILAIALGTLYPGLAFVLQFGGFHRLLTFATFPITLLASAYLLVNDFPTFASDQKLGLHTLLTRLTWQRAIPIHHLLVLLSFLFFAMAPSFGFPWGVIWPVFLAMPFAGIQIIWLQRIAAGGRTLWKFMITLAAATFGLTIYLLAIAFWNR